MFKKHIKTAQTIVWNGPLGVFEFDKFAEGTNEVAKILGNLDAITIIGGGDSAAAIEKMGDNVILCDNQADSKSETSCAQKLIGHYANINTMIPKGSLFYEGAVVPKSDLPDAAVYDVKKGEITLTFDKLFDSEDIKGLTTHGKPISFAASFNSSKDFA